MPKLIHTTHFEYSQLGEHADFVERVAGNVKLQTRMASRTVIDVGAQLCDVKQRIGHGLFNAWLKVEFGWSARTAERLMQTAMLKGKSDSVSHLTASALYGLTAKSTPRAVRDAIILELEQGVHLGEVQIAARINSGKKVVAGEGDCSAEVGLRGNPMDGDEASRLVLSDRETEESMHVVVRTLVRAFRKHPRKLLALLQHADIVEIQVRVEELLFDT